MPDRRFSPPWDIEDNGACFIIRDKNGQALSYVYYENEPGRRSAGATHRHQYRQIAGADKAAPVLSKRAAAITQPQRPP
jgi:hypothetical protein